jgi:hypothetical protein
MTANINPLNNIAFYYGGIPLSTDGKTPVYPAVNIHIFLCVKKKKKPKN